MFYIKTKLTDDIEIKVDIYDDEIFTQCPECGKEITAEAEMLKTALEHGDLASTTVVCKECVSKHSGGHNV